MQKAEAVQLKFLRVALGLHKNGSGVVDEVVRAEAGCERLQDRWAKLRLGYWRRVFVAPNGRLLRDVVEFRRREWIASGGRGWGSRGWMSTIKATLDRHGLGVHWDNPASAVAMPKARWKDAVYAAVDASANSDRVVVLSNKPSATPYIDLKDWGPNPVSYSFSVGESGKLGQLVPERYLDDRRNLKGTRLKMLCRLGCLPLMTRVGREATPPWPREYRTCAACCTGKIEDVRHFVMECPRYADKRATLLKQAVRELAGSKGDVSAIGFASMEAKDQLAVLLGRRISDPAAEDRLDRSVKRYLTKCWNLRARVAGAINEALFTSYGIYAALGA